jgi:hypothetical protein
VPEKQQEETGMNLTRPIVVVDRRTYRIARRTIDALMQLGDYTRAKFGVTAALLWLRYEIRTGPRRHRIRYAADLEQLEIVEDQVKPTWNSWRSLRTR